MLQKRVPDDEAGPGRFAASLPGLGACGHVGDRELQLLTAALDPLLECEPFWHRTSSDQEAGIRETSSEIRHRSLRGIENQDPCERTCGEVGRHGDAVPQARFGEVPLGNPPESPVHLREGYTGALGSDREEGRGVARCAADDADVEPRPRVHQLEEGSQGGRGWKHRAPEGLRIWDRRVRERERYQVSGEESLKIHRAKRALDGRIHQEPTVYEGAYQLLPPAHVRWESVPRV